MTCLVFKTTCIDAEKPLREGAFFFTRRTLFSPLNKRNKRDTEKGLCISSERHTGELGMRCLAQQVGAGLSETVSYIAMLWARRATREHARNGRGSKATAIEPFALGSVVVCRPNQIVVRLQSNSCLPISPPQYGLADEEEILMREPWPTSHLRGIHYLYTSK